ncbi:hypothetical protein HYFRA_00000977 [Hymenoscyphus fraxineus]|uniref:PLC-like phosphodiesterase n=1 Tax=Hymenoscyphus fraxineus TaxID=746836 RepID=A0A9N9PS72_9HELO|nr:hypothetical protein HYFRA_00000977 [Hymenoscyphus fraxineus]
MVTLETVLLKQRSPTKQHMTVQARQNGGGKRIEIQYLDSLSSLNNPENSLINLGYVHDGAVQFVLASNDGVSYVSSNPPVAWMQSTLPAIGSKTLRTLSMPASHDAGISELTYQWTGIPHNTQTQSVHVYKQLLYGVRFFDIRPVLYYGNWYSGHFSQLSTDDWVGATGRTLDHIIDDINRFTSEHPGEIIILDITHDASIDRWWARLNEDEWQNLYAKLSAINDLWVPENGNLPYDISTSPISSFIKPGSKSAVIIRIPASAPAPGSNTSKRGLQIAPRNRPDQGTLVDPNIYDTFDHEEIPVLDKENGYGVPNAILSAQELEPAHNLSTVTPRAASGPWQQAFISTNRFPLSGSYAETRWPAIMSANQLDKLSSQGSENDAPHMGFWTLTQYWTDVTDFGTPRHSIINMAKKAYRALFTDLWPAMRRENKWPNLIMADDIHNTEVAALCMAINSYFPHAPAEVKKRQLVSPVQGNGTRSMDHTRCEVQTRERNEAELKHLVSEQENALQSLREYHESQVKTLDFDLVDEDTKTRRVMAQEFEDLHQRQKSETISVNSRLNKDKEMSVEEKKRIRDELIDAQAKERLRVANMHAQALQNMKMRGGDLGTELKARQAAETKAFLERQAKELEELKREQEEFLNQVLKYYFGDGRMPYCPKTRDDFPIPENTYKPARLSYSKKVSKPVYTSAHSSARRYSYVVVPTGASHAAASPYALSKAYSTSGRYYAAPTGGYKYVSKPYYPVATGAYHVPSKQSYPTGAYYVPSKQSYPTGAYYAHSKQSYPTGAYYVHSKQSHPTGAYYVHSKQSHPTGAYYIHSQQSYPTGAYNSSPRPGNAYNRPYYQLPSNQSVIHTNAYGPPKPYQTAPVKALYPNITTATVTQAHYFRECNRATSGTDHDYRYWWHDDVYGV